MHDPRLDQLARVIVRYCAEVTKDDLVLITGAPVTEPAICAVYQEVLRAGGHPWVRMDSPACREVLLKCGRDWQLRYTSPFDKHIMSKCDVRIVFVGDENTRALSGVDPSRQALLELARRPILSAFLKRAARSKDDPKRARWTGAPYPTHANAQEAEMSLSDYADFVFSACKLDRPNPATEWTKLGSAQTRLCQHLDTGKEMHIQTPQGTDIRFGIEGRRWINCDGHENFPDGEVFTAPIEDSTEGVVLFSFPALLGGREVSDIRLEFKAGRVVDASASKNEPFLLTMLDTDRGARVLGELALGTNYDIQRFTHNMLFDEKIGGTCHLALGASFPESGGKNKSCLHWDLVCDLRDGGVVTVDGETVSSSGKFTRKAWPQP